MSVAPSTKVSGGLTPLPFAVAVAGVYLLSFLSQTLLSAPVTTRFSVVPFAVAQAALIGFWTLLHRRRLWDAGRPSGILIGVAALYALEMVLLTLVVWLMLPATGEGGAGPGAPILNFFVILYLLTMLTGDPGTGTLQLWMWGFVILMLLPVIIGVVFSLWALTRPRAGAAP